MGHAGDREERARRLAALEVEKAAQERAKALDAHRRAAETTDPERRERLEAAARLHEQAAELHDMAAVLQRTHEEHLHHPGKD